MSEISSSITYKSYLPKDFSFSTWEQLLPYFEELNIREIINLTSLQNWLLDKSELEAFLQED